MDNTVTYLFIKQYSYYTFSNPLVILPFMMSINSLWLNSPSPIQWLCIINIIPLCINSSYRTYHFHQKWQTPNQPNDHLILPQQQPLILSWSHLSNIYDMLYAWRECTHKSYKHKYRSLTFTLHVVFNTTMVL